MTVRPASRLKRLKWRIPVRLRHHWRLLAVGAATVTVMGVVFTTVRVAPIVTGSVSENDVITDDVAGTVDLFDDSVAHRIEISYSEEDYQHMLDMFWQDEEKEWIRAEVTIDGTTLDNVAMRLKGNSTLMGLTDPDRGARDSAPGGRGGPGGPGGGEPPEGAPGGMKPPGGDTEDGGRGPGGGMMTTELTTAEPENLPWLLDFDEYEEGRAYQGRDQLSVRVSGGAETGFLPEAVALDLVAASGEPYQRHGVTGLSVNGGKAAARLVVEHPDVSYADWLGEGVLYKSLAGGQFTYQGDALSEYSDDLKQINRVGQRDVKPVVEFLRWLDEADDDEFDAELDEWLDVDSFANYVALQNLLLNFDDMAGPGRNFYLWYDLSTKKFTVITWDLNLALSGDPSTGADEELGMSMPGGGGPGQDSDAEAGGLPGGGEPPEGFEGAPPGGGEEGMSSRMGNVLKERFTESKAFGEQRDTAYRDLYRKLYADGTALEVLDSVADAAEQADGTDPQALAKQVAALRKVIEERTEALATDPVVTGNAD